MGDTNIIYDINNKCNLKIEKAKSSRSTCKKCNQLIEKNSLRGCEFTSNDKGFNTSSNYHISCFLSIPSILSSLQSNINGFELLDDTTQVNCFRISKLLKFKL